MGKKMPSGDSLKLNKESEFTLSSNPEAASNSNSIISEVDSAFED